MHRLLAHQLARVTDERGAVDLPALLRLVDAAYTEADRSLQRTDRAALLMCEEMERLNADLMHLAHHDALTGLPNRVLFADRLAHALALVRREPGRLALLYLDLDRFKEVNDTLGHAAGDALLRGVAERLKACLRESDTLARLGGDEFAVIQRPVERLPDAEALARRLIDALEEPIDLGTEMARVGVTIGIALSDPARRNTAPQMMQDADTALYQAKDQGRGGFSFFMPAMNARLQERRALEQDLRAALARRAMFVHYQPEVDLATGNIVAAEALVRWNREGRGLIPPDRFVPIAEDSGLIEPLGTFVLREASCQAVHWPRTMRVAVNVSPLQLVRPHFVELVQATLQQAGLSPSRLELEVTERVFLHDTAGTLRILSHLRELGVQLTLDDFGTGYSSLSYLRKFRFDKIKIHRSFVRALGGDASAMAIVRAVVGLSETLQICSIAEGVETWEQAALLAEQGCREAQGYLYGRPMAGDAFTRLVAGRSH